MGIKLKEIEKLIGRTEEIEAQKYGRKKIRACWEDTGQTHWGRHFTLRRSPPGEIWILGAGQRPSTPVELAGASAVVPHQTYTDRKYLSCLLLVISAH